MKYIDMSYADWHKVSDLLDEVRHIVEKYEAAEEKPAWLLAAGKDADAIYWKGDLLTEGKRLYGKNEVQST